MAKTQPGSARLAATAAKGQRRDGATELAKPGRIPERGRQDLKVRAKELLYYNHMRRRDGDVFTLLRESDFNGDVMEYVDGRTPDRVTGAQAALDQVTLQEAARKRNKSADVIGATEDDE
jgi:hypothetical protein